MGFRVPFAALLVILAFEQLTVAQGPGPPAIQDFLAANPAYRLLAVEDVRDVVDRDAEEYFTPFALGDLTGDGIPEVAAVIVRRGTPVRFGVVVVHGSRTVHWVVRPHSDKIVSVEIEASRRLYVKHCLECDSNSFVRWNGSSYEDALWIVSDVPATYDPGHRPIPLRLRPTSTAKAIANVTECTDARIVEVLPRRANGVRWYRVEVVLNGRATRGFLPSDMLTDISCIG
jgi:hypothetical protein